LAEELEKRPSSAGPVDRLVAAKLLRHHASEEARTLLVRLAQDDQSSVAVIALDRLLELDPDRILPFSEASLAKGDVNVRRSVAQALSARPSATTVRQLGGLLADPNPGLRILVRRSLVTLAESAELRPLIIEQGVRMLGDDRWQPLEQSMKLLVALEHKDQTDRFVELLEFPRPEVHVTAAWALRKSAVDETLEPILEFAKKQNADRKDILAQDLSEQGLDVQLAQILQFFGQKKYVAAEEFLRSFVPKDFDLFEARGAAIWALGYLHEGKPDPELVKQLEERIKDTAGMEPELAIVRRFAAISLGRMQARDALPTLEGAMINGRISGYVEYGCAWAIQQITGRTFDPPAAPTQMYSNFFIEPLDMGNE
jgi:HEAT repeat protein